MAFVACQSHLLTKNNSRKHQSFFRIVRRCVVQPVTKRADASAGNIKRKMCWEVGDTLFLQDPDMCALTSTHTSECICSNGCEHKADPERLTASLLTAVKGHNCLGELLSTFWFCHSAPGHKVKFKNSQMSYDLMKLQLRHESKNKALGVSDGGGRQSAQCIINPTVSQRKLRLFSHKQEAYVRRMTPLTGRIECLSCGSRRGKRKTLGRTCLVSPERPETEVALSAFLLGSPSGARHSLTEQPANGAEARWLAILAPLLGHFCNNLKKKAELELS